MMDGIVRNHASCFVPVPSTSVQIAIEAWEVAARYFDSNSISCLEVVARRHR